MRLTIDPCAPRPSTGSHVPPSLERAIAARWQIWVPWVRMHVLRARQSDPTVSAAIDGPASCRMREGHTEHILDLMRDGISMRTIRRHRVGTLMAIREAAGGRDRVLPLTGRTTRPGAASWGTRVQPSTQVSRECRLNVARLLP